MSWAKGAVLRERFEIRDVLGTGGMGAVYRAYDRELGTEVAVKSVRHASPQAFYRLKEEFRALAGVRHRNLVRLGELFGEEDVWFFSMEIVRGLDFLKWVRWTATRPVLRPTPDTLPPPADGDPTLPSPAIAVFDERRLRATLGQLAHGLETLHRAGRVHRDVKPSNVLVEADTGRVVLLDFGLARLTDRRTTASGKDIAGTVEFMAPEVANRAETGPASDWYAVGAMLYEALTGQLPFDGQPLEILAQKVNLDPAPPSTLTRDIPPDLEAACMALLARDPEARADGTILHGVSGTAELRSGSLRLPPRDGPFVGRHRELASLQRAFDDSRKGRPVMVRLVAESGLGKSALARQFVEEISEIVPEVVVLEGRCYAHELVPYKAWDGVVDAITRELRRIESSAGSAQAAWLLPSDVHALARVFPALRRVPAVAGLVSQQDPATSPERLRRQAFDALRELLKSLGREGPVVVVIDDFHWADRDSRLLLDDLLTAHDAPPLLLLVTERPGPNVKSAVPARRITVPALTSEDTHALAQGLLSALRRPVPEDLDGVVRESGGHPLFLQQLLREADREGGPPPRLDDMIRSRVERLEPDARRLLEVVCVSGAPLDLATVAAATSLDVATCRELADALEADQLLRAGPDDDARLHPYHDRVRESVAESLDPELLSRRHAALASALTTSSDVRGDVDRDVVRHLAEAGLREPAAAAAEIAAEQAEAALAFDRASELYRMALSLGRHDPQKRLALRLALSNALASAGHGALEAAQGFLAAADATSASDEALALRTRALEQLAMSGHADQALELLRRLCTDVGVSLPSSRLGAIFSLLRRRLELRWLGLPKSIGRFEGDTVATSLDQQLYLAAFMHLPILDPLLAAELHARVFSNALRSGELETLGLCFCREIGIVAMFAESNFAYAERVLGLAQQVFSEHSSADHRAWMIAGNGLRHYFMGHFDTALTMFRNAMEIWSGEARIYAMNISQFAVFAMGSLRYIGDLNELRRELDQARRDAEWRGNRYLLNLSTLAFQLPILLQDGLEASRRDLGRVDTGEASVLSGANAWYLARTEAEEALYRGADRAELLGHLRALSAFQRTQFGHVQTWGAELRWLLGRLWLAAADAGEVRGTAKARSIAKSLLRRRVPYAQVWGHALLSGVHTQRGDRAAAREALEECAVRGELNGLVLVAQAARVRLGEHGFGSEEARRDALAFFDTQGVADLDAAMGLLMPGFTPMIALPASPRQLPAQVEPA